MLVVKFSTLAGGVFIEETGPARLPTDRCFRFDAQGGAEYAFYADVTAQRSPIRWYAHAYTDADFLFA